MRKVDQNFAHKTNTELCSRRLNHTISNCTYHLLINDEGSSMTKLVSQCFLESLQTVNHLGGQLYVCFVLLTFTHVHTAPCCCIQPGSVITVNKILLSCTIYIFDRSARLASHNDLKNAAVILKLWVKC